MTASLVAPMIVATAVAVAVTSVHRRLPPRLAARLGTVAVVLVLLAALPTALVVALAFVAHAPVVGTGFEWCARAIGLHGSVPAWIGVPILAVLVAGAVRAARVLRDHRRLRLDAARPVHVADSARPFAVTLPGRGGQIVISTAMLDLLDEREQRIVVAHERAHARYRHDRYLLVAELAAAALPPLRALSRRVGYSVERWADEAAAAWCGDRRLVASTLGKVALQSHPRSVAGFAGLGVASRMAALMEPPVGRPGRSRILLLWAGLAVAAGFSVYQLHHLERLAMALCPH